MEVEWRLKGFILDAEEVTVVNSPSSHVVLTVGWFNHEYTLRLGLAQVKFTAAILLTHFLGVEGQVLSCKHVSQLKRRSVGQLSTNSIPLFVQVTFVLVLLEFVILVNLH